MRGCRKCGKSTYPDNTKTCRSCRDAWLEKRMKAFRDTAAEMGPLTYENQEAFRASVKKKERQ